MLYPFKFYPVYKDYLWGGRNLERLGKVLPEGKTAESWEVSCHPGGVSVIANGPFEGTPLPDLIKSRTPEIAGTALPGKEPGRFPLLVKFIDASEELSVQVHPGDSYAALYENGECGKNEMWYILSAVPGAQLIYDVMPGVNREAFADAIRKGNPSGCLKRVEVYPGDVIYIPSGVVHAIGRGIMLAEIQQNSNVTYRVYDFDRVDRNGKKRELHISKALDVIDFNSGMRKVKYRGIEINNASGTGCSRRFLAASRFFAAELYSLDGSLAESAEGSRFFIYSVIEGEGIISGAWGNLDIRAGESVFIPAAIGKFSIKGKLKALKSYVPDIESDILAPLRKAGFTDIEIITNVAGINSAGLKLAGLSADQP